MVRLVIWTACSEILGSGEWFGRYREYSLRNGLAQSFCLVYQVAIDDFNINVEGVGKTAKSIAGDECLCQDILSRARKNVVRSTQSVVSTYLSSSWSPVELLCQPHK